MIDLLDDIRYVKKFIYFYFSYLVINVNFSKGLVNSIYIFISNNYIKFLWRQVSMVDYESFVLKIFQIMSYIKDR